MLWRQLVSWNPSLSRPTIRRQVTQRNVCVLCVVCSVVFARAIQRRKRRLLRGRVIRWIWAESKSSGLQRRRRRWQQRRHIRRRRAPSSPTLGPIWSAEQRSTQFQNEFSLKLYSKRNLEGKSEWILWSRKRFHISARLCERDGEISFNS